MLLLVELLIKGSWARHLVNIAKEVELDILLILFWKYLGY